MEIVLVAATEMEVETLARQAAAGAFAPLNVWALVTGIGMVNTAFQLGRITGKKPDWLINVGICGAFDRTLPLGTAVHITHEHYADLGAEDHDRWLDLEALGFAHFSARGRDWHNHLANPAPPHLPLPSVRGSTSNTVLGHAPSITLAQQRDPEAQVQTMEGAAFFQGALLLGCHFCAIRGVSNYVEPRNRAAWQLAQAVQAAQAATANFLKLLAATR